MLPTVVPVFLLCCLCQLGCTKDVGPVARSNVTFPVHVIEKLPPRRRRQTAECEDVVEEKKATTIQGKSQNTSATDVQACKAHCLRTITCRAAVYAKGKCAYGVSDESSTVTGKDASTTTYFKVVYRCPRYYRCQQSPCKNGATCKTIASEGVGIECVCAAGWKSWFCEEKAEDTVAEDAGDEDTGMSNTDKTVIAAAIVGVVGATGVAAAIAVVKATGATAASTAGAAAVGYDQYTFSWMI